MPQWRRNLWILAFGDFISGAGFSMSLPFLPLFINQMASFSNEQLTFYSGLAYAIAYVSQAIVSPLWGKLADKTGRKPMILRSAFGMCLTGLFCGFAHNVWTIIFWRFIYGCFSGFNSNSQALVASEVPKNQGGKAMGITCWRSINWSNYWRHYCWYLGLPNDLLYFRCCHVHCWCAGIAIG